MEAEHAMKGSFQDAEKLVFSSCFKSFIPLNSHSVCKAQLPIVIAPLSPYVRLKLHDQDVSLSIFFVI
jgi:hypothetical protein